MSDEVIVQLGETINIVTQGIQGPQGPPGAAADVEAVIAALGAALGADGPGVLFSDDDLNLAVNNDTFVFDNTNSRLKLFDKDYAAYLGGTNYFSLGSNSAVPISNHFAADDVSFPLVLSGASKSIFGRRTNIAITGSMADAFVIGNLVTLSSGAYAGTGSLYGFYSNVDLSFPATAAIGGRFAVIHSGSGASGANTITGVQGNASLSHNGPLINAYAGDFWINSSQSFPASTTSLAISVRTRASVSPDCIVTELRGVSIAGWTNTGTVNFSAGIYADASIDTGDDPHFIYSLSESPSLFSGPVAVPDDAYGPLWNGSGDVPNKAGIFDKFESTIANVTLFGMPSIDGLKGGQIVHTVLASGMNDLYTVPAGWKAIAYIAYHNKTGVAINGNYQAVKRAGIYYKLSPANNGIANGSNVQQSFFIYEPGDVVAFSAANVGLTSRTSIFLFPETVPFKSYALLGMATGDNLLYEAPAGKVGLFCQSSFNQPGINANSALLILNDTGGSVVYTGYHIPAGGGSPTIDQRFFTQSVATGGTSTGSTPKMANPGEKIIINSSSGAAGQVAFWTIYDAAI